MAVLPDVLEQQRLVLLPGQPLLPRVDALLANKAVELPGQEKLPPARALDDTCLQKVRQPRPVGIRKFLLAADEVEDEEVKRTEPGQALLTDTFEEADEMGVLHRPVQG